MFSIDDLPPRWSEDAATFRRRGREDLALFIESLIAELEAEMRTEEDEVLTIAQAAVESGYGKDHLRKLVRDGIIPNSGEPHSPRIRRRDLPRKPGHAGHGERSENVVNYSSYTKSNGERPTAEYDPEEDARSIAERMRRQ